MEITGSGWLWARSGEAVLMALGRSPDLPIVTLRFCYRLPPSFVVYGFIVDGGGSFGFSFLVIWVIIPLVVGLGPFGSDQVAAPWRHSCGGRIVARLSEFVRLTPASSPPTPSPPLTSQLPVYFLLWSEYIMVSYE